MIYEDKKGQFFLFEKTAPIDYPLHIHQLLEIVHILKGTISMRIGQKHYTLQKGDFCIIFPNVIHSYSIPHMVMEDTDYLIMNIHPNILPFFQEILLNKRPDNPFLPPHQVHEDIIFAENRLKSTEYSRDSIPLIGSLSSLILSRVFPNLKLSIHDYNTPQDLAGEILAYIGSHYTEDISQAYVASLFGINKCTLSRIFTNSLDMNYNYYINSLRINHAKHLLTTDKTLPITDISFECGYHNQQTFNRVFKDLTGTTPNEYRKQGKENLL